MKEPLGFESPRQLFSRLLILAHRDEPVERGGLYDVFMIDESGRDAPVRIDRAGDGT
ncbi:hypothetical protein [Paenibacillus apiarius]|uniref:Uncharacterized protein n=2 Tax=Paenibacillus apiarius TaxID=46240 RepID=A0ABT4DSW6_9BACL|nr:hypothetical protein [Paenibacillus apiarius]MCY9515736.1 hypothetical protein [Paenibacillus apiarius]MCY9520450.1 hypothetical protein [Paenibacillus apiarius]MCY9683101.1 hypothetical protein [Paenibacillus apiarius]MCY9792862.1 hypothetical protein [Paenibacillus apiarius]MEC0117714.1 hypothetical protein [Paenibacillus apiarius]